MAYLGLASSIPLTSSISTASSSRTRTTSQTLATSFLSQSLRIAPASRSTWRSRTSEIMIRSCAYTVEIEHNGELHRLQVEEGESVLEKALEEGLDVPHDCKLGVCMTCPAKLLSGSVDQSGGMLSDDVIDKGYALLCTSVPLSDCRFKTIPEEELLSLQLVTAQQ